MVFDPAHRAQPTFQQRVVGLDPVVVREGAAMAKGDIETYFENGQWKNQPQGNTRASSTHDTKAETQAAGHQMAIDRDLEHVIKAAGRNHPGEEHVSPQPRNRPAPAEPERWNGAIAHQRICAAHGQPEQDRDLVHGVDGVLDRGDGRQQAAPPTRPRMRPAGAG
jgi:Uncharacterized protein conserved in bacteria (DUF2188)